MDNSNYKRVLFAILGIIGTILFFASFLPYLALVVAAVEGCKEGLFGGRYIYGAQAVKTVLIWMSIIPVFPVCFRDRILISVPVHFDDLIVFHILIIYEDDQRAPQTYCIVRAIAVMSSAVIGLSAVME